MRLALALLASLAVASACKEIEHFDGLEAHLDVQNRLHLLAPWARETEGGTIDEGYRYLPIEQKPKLSLPLPFAATNQAVFFALDPQGRALVHTSAEYHLFDGRRFSPVTIPATGLCPADADPQFQTFHGASGSWTDEAGLRVLALGPFGATQQAVYSISDWSLDGCQLVDLPPDHPTLETLAISSPDPYALFLDAAGGLSPYVLRDGGAGQQWQPVPGAWTTDEVGRGALLTHTGAGQAVVISRQGGVRFSWPGGFDDPPLRTLDQPYFDVKPGPGGGLVAASAQLDGAMQVFIYDAGFTRTDVTLEAEGKHLLAIALAVREEADGDEVIHLLTAEGRRHIRDYRLSPTGELLEVVELR